MPSAASRAGTFADGTKWSANPQSSASPGPIVAEVSPRWVPVPPGARASRRLPPTSGTRPILVSGMATTERSVTTRTAPWAETPTPPPMVMPSITAR